MTKSLRELADVHYGKSPSDVLHEDGQFPVVGTGGVYGRACRPLFHGPAVVVPRKGSLGNPQYMTEPFWPVDTTYAVLPKRGVDASWLYYSLARFDLTRLNEATGVPSISRDWLYKVNLADQDYPNQQRIAEILSTVDEAIEQTEVLIAKTQQIKAGLMHDLFTRGVTPDGHLRPPREKAPHLYKESPLGWIPKEWGSPLLDDVAVRGSGHTPSQSHPEYWNGGIKWLSLADSWRLSQVYVDETDKNVSAAGLANSSATLLPVGTVIISRDGSRLGKSGILGTDMAVSQHFIAWTCSSGLSNIFLYWSLQHRKREFENVATGSTIPTIGLQFFKRYRIACPAEINEQKGIGQVLLSADQETVTLEGQRQKLVLFKAGLMHDLLTGRMRVKVSDPASA